MRIAFTATDGRSLTEFDTVICGVAGGDQWLTFQRGVENSPDDWGIYLEYSDQSNSGYDCAATCRMESQMLCVDLEKPLSKLRDVTGFDITLKLDQASIKTVQDGLCQIYRDRLHLLIVD